MNTKLVYPTSEMKPAVMEFKEEFYKKGELTIPGSYKLDQERYSYEMWVELIHSNRFESSANPKFGTSDTMFALDEEGNIVGIVNFRHTLTPFYQDKGHVGISVRPSMRNLNYGKSILAQMLLLAKEKGLSEIKLVCNKTNLASKRIITACNGTLSRTFVSDTDAKEEYLIHL